MRGDKAQILLIISGLLVAALFSAFLYREIFPEYKIYQNDYLALEEFRSTYTHTPLPPFQSGIKQIVIEREDRGPATIDRCTSCHVALQIPYFSPTKIAYDLNGNIVRDSNGHPLQIPNEEFIWQKLDEKIAELRDEKVLKQLRNHGESDVAHQRLEQANKYESLKTAHVNGNVYDVTKILVMHPLMGNETYPFQFHPIEEYGCTSCHNGNGRGLVTDKAHGPVFDGQYEIEEEIISPYFTEPDSRNDPKFARVFNHKPGDKLIFQTEPIYVGALIQAKCMQCHLTSDVKISDADTSFSNMALMHQEKVQRLETAYNNERQSLTDLLQLKAMIKNEGIDQTIHKLNEMVSNYSLPAQKQEQLAAQIHYLQKASKGLPEGEKAINNILEKLDTDLINLLGSINLVNAIENVYRSEGEKGVGPFLKLHQNDLDAKGILFTKATSLDYNQDLMRHSEEAEQSFSNAAKDQKLMTALVSDVDELTRDFQRGRNLYISQACYACHRISGFSRGGVGPELTRSGLSYPWFLKRKLVWPQADLPTSTMPNMHFDTKELADIMTFLLSLKGGNRAVSKTDYQSGIQTWETGRKVDFEKPVSPAQMYDLRYSMTVFATQGCAACHRLQGFESNVGFAVEKDSDKSFDKLYEQKQWFRKLFPEVVHYSYYDEDLPGSEIVAAVDNNALEIDRRIVGDVRQNSILEEIGQKYPDSIESLYSPFRYALRAKNDYYSDLMKKENDPVKVALLQKEHEAYKERIHRVLMMYIQIYGFGRLIGPHLNWSGISRTDEWLMEHFRNPPAHVPRSLMPVFPFDDTKFYALTHMLDVLAVRNRDAIRQIWNNRGFDPAETYEMLCSQCHGVGMIGNGIIAEWIYPIPKNLHNPEFLRNLTKDKAIESIAHGIKGTPMPPWNMVASDKSADIQKISKGIPILNESEIQFLVDWLFTGLPGGQIIRQSSDVPKWQYTPENLTSFFDVVPNPNHENELSYYIKKKYYTPENIEEGHKFFLLNCAVCHGNEADGTGIRSQAMKEAKPRMLTNLDWINSRDDLRLLRSIKFGIPGTSMTPWGDLTNETQRMQLVIFIRSLTKEKEQRNKLLEALYQAFENPQFIVESARIESNKKMNILKEQLSNLHAKQAEVEIQIEQGKENPQTAFPIYQQILDVEKQINKILELDQQFNSIKLKLKSERELYYQIGMGLAGKDLSDAAWQYYIDLIHSNGNRFELQGQHLINHFSDNSKLNVRIARQHVVEELDHRIAELERHRQVIEGKIASSQQREELSNNRLELDGYKKIRAKLITDTEEALRLAEEEANIVNQFRTN